MLKHFLWDYFLESGDLDAYIMYKELESVESNYFNAGMFGNRNELNDI